MSDEAKDDENPYRSPAFVEETEAEEIERSASTIAVEVFDELRRLKEIDRDCRHILGVATLYFASFALLLVEGTFHRIDARSYSDLSGHAAVIGGVVHATSAVSLLAVGAKLAVTTYGRTGCFAAIGLLVPGLNVVLSAIFFRRAMRILEERGVQFGWFASDYSRVDVDRPVRQEPPA